MNNEHTQLTPTVIDGGTEKFVVSRDNDLPLRFNGRLVAEKSEQRDVNGYFLGLEIYETWGQKFVVSRIHEIIHVDGRFRRRREAEVLTSAAAVIQWLRDDEGTLHRLAIELLTAAAEVDSRFEQAFGLDIG